VHAGIVERSSNGAEGRRVRHGKDTHHKPLEARIGSVDRDETTIPARAPAGRTLEPKRCVQLGLSGQQRHALPQHSSAVRAAGGRLVVGELEPGSSVGGRLDGRQLVVVVVGRALAAGAQCLLRLRVLGPRGVVEHLPLLRHALRHGLLVGHGRSSLWQQPVKALAALH
jgi:hypothetical protein